MWKNLKKAFGPIPIDHPRYAIRIPKLFFLIILILVASFFIFCKSPIQELTISVTHRVFTDYHEEIKIKMGEKYQLSDADYYVRAVAFVPDFAIDTSTGKFFSRSDSLKNPAVKLEVFKKGKKLEEAWAFQKVQAPHFSKHSFLGFKLIDFKIEDKFKKVEN